MFIDIIGCKHKALNGVRNNKWINKAEGEAVIL
jgi:hypothetical protein